MTTKRLYRPSDTIQIEDLKLMHTNDSSYFKLWHELKQTNKVSFKVSRIAKDMFIEAIEKQKQNDTQYKCYCALTLGYQLRLSFQYNEQTGDMLVTLVDTKAKLSVINFL